MHEDDKYYTKYDIGDIVMEDTSVVYNDEKPLIGLVLDVDSHVYFLGDDDYEISQDQLAVFWFKTNRIEYIPSDFVNLFSR